MPVRGSGVARANNAFVGVVALQNPLRATVITRLRYLICKLVGSVDRRIGTRPFIEDGIARRITASQSMFSPTEMVEEKHSPSAAEFLLKWQTKYL